MAIRKNEETGSTQSEPIEMVSRSLDVIRWREKADNAALWALKSNRRNAKDLEIESICSKVGELTVILEFRDEKIERLEAGRAFVRKRGGQGNECRRLGLREKTYGIEWICKAWRMS